MTSTNAKTLYRYILKEILGLFGICLIAFTGILLTVRILKFADLVVSRGVAFGQIVMVFVSIIPTFLEVAIPMSALLGVMLAIARMSGDSEIVVIRASGISLSQLIRPVMVFGLFTAACSLLVSVQLRPWGYQKLSRTLFEIARTRSTSGLNPGVFNDLGKLMLFAETIDYESGDINAVLIDDRRDPASRQIVTAREGRIASNDTNQTITLYLREGQIHEKLEDKYSLTNYVTNSIVMDPDELFASDQNQRRLRELSLGELAERKAQVRNDLEKLNAGEELEANDSGEAPDEKYLRKSLAEIVIEAGRRFSMPFASLVLALVAFPLGIQPARTHKAWGAGISIVLGLLVFVFYYGLLSIGIALAESLVLPATIALWLPNIFAAVLAWIGIKKMGAEEWQSIAHAVEEFLMMLMNAFQRIRLQRQV